MVVGGGRCGGGEGLGDVLPGKPTPTFRKKLRAEAKWSVLGKGQEGAGSRTRVKPEAVCEKTFTL